MPEHARIAPDRTFQALGVERRNLTSVNQDEELDIVKSSQVPAKHLQDALGHRVENVFHLFLISSYPLTCLGR